MSSHSLSASQLRPQQQRVVYYNLALHWLISVRLFWNAIPLHLFNRPGYRLAEGGDGEDLSNWHNHFYRSKTERWSLSLTPRWDTLWTFTLRSVIFFPDGTDDSIRWLNNFKSAPRKQRGFTFNSIAPLRTDPSYLTHLRMFTEISTSEQSISLSLDLATSAGIMRHWKADDDADDDADDAETGFHFVRRSLAIFPCSIAVGVVSQLLMSINLSDCGNLQNVYQTTALLLRLRPPLQWSCPACMPTCDLR